VIYIGNKKGIRKYMLFAWLAITNCGYCGDLHPVATTCFGPKSRNEFWGQRAAKMWKPTFTDFVCSNVKCAWSSLQIKLRWISLSWRAETFSPEPCSWAVGQWSKTENTAVGIRHTDHTIPPIRKSWHYLRRQAKVARSVEFARGIKPRSYYYYKSKTTCMPAVFGIAHTNDILAVDMRPCCWFEQCRLCMLHCIL
jgi:hypothetical protein